VKATAREGHETVLRTPTPTMSLLSSPPPTLQTPIKQSAISKVNTTLSVPSPSEISSASPVKIHAIFQETALKFDVLSTQLQEARTNAAHFKLQHNLLSIEAEEAVRRMEVEHEMTRREVEVLQGGEYGDIGPDGVDRGSRQAREVYNAELRQHVQAVNEENKLLKSQFQRAKKILKHREVEVASLTEANAQLRTRIRENRDHLNRLRGPGGPYEFPTPQNSNAAPVTPNRWSTRQPNSARSANVSRSQDEGQDAFAALLYADQFLSQESATAPSTPTTVRPAKSSSIGHTRGTHSLSSLPTVQDSRPATANGASLLPPASFSTAKLQASPSRLRGLSRERRRESRDSTISASDTDDRAGHESTDEEDDEIPASQASQLATSMLRLSQGAKIPPAASAAPKTSGLLQAKLLGQVKKTDLDEKDSVVSKKRGRDDLDRSNVRDIKRMRATEGVGLGIGLDGSK
jgi:acetyl-CoA acyltransferase 1